MQRHLYIPLRPHGSHLPFASLLPSVLTSSFMTSSSQMIQVYQDEEGGVGEHAPFLPHPPALNDANPRWAKHSSRRTRIRRLAIASGAFLTLYLLFCTWVAYARNEVSLPSPILWLAYLFSLIDLRL